MHHVLYDVFDEAYLALWYAAGGTIKHWHHDGHVSLLLLVRLHEILLGNTSGPFDAVLHGTGGIAHIRHLDQHATHKDRGLLLTLGMWLKRFYTFNKCYSFVVK